MNPHRSCTQRSRYRFMGRQGDSLVWERHVPNDSRVEQIMCKADWFYSLMVSGNPAPDSERTG